MEGNYIFHQDSKTYSPDQQPSHHGETAVYSTQRIDLFNNISWPLRPQENCRLLKQNKTTINPNVHVHVTAFLSYIELTATSI